MTFAWQVVSRYNKGSQIGMNFPQKAIFPRICENIINIRDENLPKFEVGEVQKKSWFSYWIQKVRRNGRWSRHVDDKHNVNNYQDIHKTTD